jgi:hypothetical protein
MKSILVLVLLIFCFSSNGQNIRNVEFKQVNNTIEIFYEASNPKNQKTNVKVFFSQNDGFTYSECISVSGDVGDSVTLRRNNRIIWEVTDDLDELNGALKFRVEVDAFPGSLKATYWAANIGFASLMFEDVNGFAVSALRLTPGLGFYTTLSNISKSINGFDLLARKVYIGINHGTTKNVHLGLGVFSGFSRQETRFREFSSTIFGLNVNSLYSFGKFNVMASLDYQLLGDTPTKNRDFDQITGALIQSSDSEWDKISLAIGIGYNFNR